MFTLRRVCPFCGTRFNRPLDQGVGEWTGDSAGLWSVKKYSSEETYVGSDGSQSYRILAYQCPKCGELTVDAEHRTYGITKHRNGLSSREQVESEEVPLRPRGTERPVPADVPAGIADDYREATRVMGLSLKAAATMARRCLQRIIREAHPSMPASAKRRLVDEIEWVIANSTWDQDVKDTLHHLREAGNFGAHPGGDGLTEIYELSEDDLEACLVLLEHLFQQVYVEPARRRASLAGLRARVPVRGKGGATPPATQAPAQAPNTTT